MKNWVTVQIPLAAGLDTKSDARASSPPSFDLLRDVEWEQPGGLQTRKPFTDLGVNIFSGGTLSNIRRLEANGDERLCFTREGLYSWSSSISMWTLKATHMAVSLDEQTSFATNGDQIDCDRAELSGVIVYAWTQGGVVYVAAKDKTSGATLMVPTAPFTGSGVGTRPRLVALTTKILLFWHDGTDAVPGNLKALAIDPADVLSSILSAAATVLATGSFGSYYDVCKVDAADTAAIVCRRVTTTSYTIATLTAGMSLAIATVARTCAQGIAVASIPGGTSVQVVRSDAGALLGDLIVTATLADVGAGTTGTAVGSYSGGLNQVTLAFATSKVGGNYRAHAFWSYGETDNAVNWQSSHNWVDTGGVVGTEGLFVRRLGVASRAFEYNERIYVWMAFASVSSFTGSNTAGFRAAPQNSYFLYRDPDNTGPLLCAKSTTMKAGGFSPSVCRLPGVALTSGTTVFSWCATERRIIPVSLKQTNYDARAPRDVTFTFDSNLARRCARIGRTLYVSGGELLQYDGAGLFEAGFHVYPWYFDGVISGAGSIANGAYAYKATRRWDNAQGERERSTTATVATLTMAGGPLSFLLTGVPLYVTHKASPRAPAFEIWRTKVNPLAGDPFHLVTGLDPAVTANPNGYRRDDASLATLVAWQDTLSDASVGVLQPNPENDGVLENLAPPACTIVFASADRLFLAGIAGDPQRIWYSKLRNDGEVCAFHDQDTVAIPSWAGAITGLGLLNETLIAFTDDAVFALDGQGYDNLGTGSNYGPARMLSSDVGAIAHESIAFTPSGLIFKSSKGWYLLNRGWGVEYIGAAVASFDAEAVLAVHLVESQHQVRCLTASRMLVFDYLVNQWAEWTVSGGAHAALIAGTHHYVTSSAVKYQVTDYTGITYGLVAKLAPIKLNDLQGAGSVRWLNILGEYRGGHRLQIDLYRDYATTPYQTTIWTPSPTTIGEPLQVSVGPSIPKCMAIGIKISALPVITGEFPSYSEALKLTGLALEVGIDKGINRRLPAAQKT